MAIPLIPIILAVASLASSAVQGVSNAKQAKSEAKAVQQLALQQVNERARQARKLMSQQKTSFLKGGVYFEGTPEAVINETYDFSQQDINAITKDADMKTNNLMRQGKTAFFNSIAEGVMKAAASFALGGIGSSAGASASKFGNAISNSKAGTAVQHWYNAKRGWNVGGFGNVGNNGNTIV